MRSAVLAAASLFLLVAWTPFPTAVGPEVPLDAPPYVSTYSLQPRLASVGHGALLLSEEIAFSRVGEQLSVNYTAPLDADGAPVGESSPFGPARNASLASSGRGYLVTFEDAGFGYAVRFTSAGTRIDLTPIALGVRGSIGEVAWDGTAYVVAVGSKLVSIAEDGRVLGTRDILNFDPIAQVATRNGVTIVVNQGNDMGLHAPLLAQVVGGELHRLGSGASADIAAGGPGFLVVYEDLGVIAGRLLDPSGQPDGRAFQVASAGRDPVVAWNGSEWLVAYEVGTTVQAVRVLRGPVAPSFGVTSAGLNPFVAPQDGRIAIAWDEWKPGNLTEVRTATIDGQQVDVAAVTAGRAHAAQTSVQMTALDGASLLAWYDGQTRVRRMDGASPMQTIDDAGIPYAFGTGEGSALLVSRVSSAIAFTRVDRNGARLGTQRIQPGMPIDRVDVAWVGNQWIAVWRGAGLIAPLYRVAIQADGAVGTPRPFGPQFVATTQGLTVTAAGSKALVLWSVNGAGTFTFAIDETGGWTQGRTLPVGMLEATGSGRADVLVTRVRDGAVEWQRVLLDGTIAARGEAPLPVDGMTVQTFFTGENYLLLLSKKESAPHRIDLYGLRVDVSGAPIDPAPVRFTSAYTVLPPNLVAATLRDGSTVDLAYFRALDEAGLFHAFPRLVFRTVHDSPRRRVVR